MNITIVEILEQYTRIPGIYDSIQPTIKEYAVFIRIEDYEAWVTVSELSAALILEQSILSYTQCIKKKHAVEGLDTGISTRDHALIKNTL